MKKIISLLITLSILSVGVMAEDFGAQGALTSTEFTIKQMLNYAIQDEYLALNEYEALVEKFGVTRPYTNIIKAEKTHITYLEELYNNYEISIPLVDTSAFINVPSNLSEAAEIGVEAEVQNILMYEKFLEQDLQEDIREVFIHLKEGSENHLRAFKRQLDTNGRGGLNRKG